MGAFQTLPAIPAEQGQMESSMTSLIPGQASPPNAVQEQAKAVMSQIRQLMMTTETLAAQFPVAAQALQVAMKAFEQALVLIVSDVNRTQTSAPTPRTLA